MIRNVDIKPLEREINELKRLIIDNTNHVYNCETSISVYEANIHILESNILDEKDLMESAMCDLNNLIELNQRDDGILETLQEKLNEITGSIEPMKAYRNPRPSSELTICSYCEVET